MFDTLILNGLVYDGSGSPGIRTDLAIKDGRIAAIGDLSSASARDRVDATGLAVTPGFIDLHTHSDFTLLVDGEAQSQVHQGVTTEVVGQCGSSCAPLRDHKARSSMSAGHASNALGDKRWQHFGEYLDAIDTGPRTTQTEVRGYKVKVTRQNLASEGVAKRRAAVAGVIARSLKKQKDD